MDPEKYVDTLWISLWTIWGFVSGLTKFPSDLTAGPCWCRLMRPFIKAEQRKDFDAIANGVRHQKSR